MMWDKKEFNTEALEATTVHIDFNYEGDKEIKSINKSCGCTNVKWVDSSTLRLSIDVGLVEHNVHPRLNKDYYIKFATVDIIYADDEVDTLKVEIKVVKNDRINNEVSDKKVKV